MNNGFSHLDNKGNARVVDISKKKKSFRYAKAQATVWLSKKILEMIKNDEFKKGNVINVARIAGIMGAKQTANLIPLCHPLGLDHVNIEIELDQALPGVIITATCAVCGPTGVEMEAMTAVSTAALTIYDMCKSADRGMEIGCIRLTHKSGGKSGTYDAK